MASSREEIVWDAFMAAARSDWGGAAAAEYRPALPGYEDLPNAVNENSTSIAGLASATQANTQVLENYTRVVESSPVYRAAASGDEDSGTAGQIASSVFKNALGMVPLARLVLGLFGGGEPEEPAPLIKYALPPRMRIEAADGTGASLAGVDYGQDGLPRRYADGTWPGVETPTTTPAPAAPQVTVQVQAMDSRSFLDHKEDIARAVREAMLNMHALNDVVSEF